MMRCNSAHPVYLDVSCTRVSAHTGMHGGTVNGSPLSWYSKSKAKPRRTHVEYHIVVNGTTRPIRYVWDEDGERWCSVSTNGNGNVTLRCHAGPAPQPQPPHQSDPARA